MPPPSYPIKAERVHIPMRDGVRLSAHIHRPDSAEPVPAIVQVTPYRKGSLATRPPTRSWNTAMPP